MGRGRMTPRPLKGSPCLREDMKEAVWVLIAASICADNLALTLGRVADVCAADNVMSGNEAGWVYVHVAE